MKKLFYTIYAVIFRICRLFPVKRGRVALVSPHNADFNDSLGAVKAELERRGDYDIKLITRRDIEFSKNPAKLIKGAFRFFFVSSYRLATAQYVFLNDNFMPLAYINFSPETKVVQLWHAEGVFKRFGLCSALPPEIEELEKRCCKRYTHAVCSSKNVVPYYAKAFGLPEERVLPLGSARTDRFFLPSDTENLRAEFDEKYPQCRGKKLALYAPTFRDDPKRDGEIMKNFNAKKFAERFSDEYVLLIRLHPQVHTGEVEAGESAIDMTGYPDVGELVQICDLLITDYSSICMDFVLLEKPCLFYAFDLEKYERERSFFFNYEDYVPGRTAKTFDELLDMIASGDFGKDRQEKFKNFNFDALDGKSAERIVDAIVK